MSEHLKSLFKITCIICCLFQFCSASAQDQKIDQPAMGFAVIIMENLIRSRKWYADIFGCTSVQVPTITQSFSQANLEYIDFR